ncbi:unnamed protein product [Linum trigynum]|uniref:Uncharacterized protein n=1 Tax=Linum trigynum TaxID=586398 RepID=A0AAV2FG03_9ROSI
MMLFMMEYRYYLTMRPWWTHYIVRFTWTRDFVNHRCVVDLAMLIHSRHYRSCNLVEIPTLLGRDIGYYCDVVDSGAQNKLESETPPAQPTYL